MIMTKFIKTKIKSYEDKINTYFYDKTVPKKCIMQMFVTDNVRFCY